MRLAYSSRFLMTPMLSSPKAAEAECVPDQPDLGASLDDHRRLYEIEELARIQREANDIHTMRLEYANRIFTLVVLWLIAVGIAVLASGFGGVNDRGFYLSDKVLIAFISSTTINVIGLFIVVAKWMYPSTPTNGKPSDDKQQFTISVERKKE
jgi:hypothetical protein